MNIRPNNIGQQRPSPQQKPLSAKALAEQLKAEGEAEVTRGEELQKDGVVLQTKGTVMAEGGKTSVQIGEGSVANGEAKVEEGQAQKAEGESKILSGLQAETVARNSENQHSTEFQVGLDAAKSSRESADKTIETLQAGLNAEKEASAAEGGQLNQYGSSVLAAGANRAASEILQGSAAAEFEKEKAAQGVANEATASFKAGIDTGAEGRATAKEGRNDVRVSDDLKDQAENANIRARGYLDRAVAHLDEAGNLKEEAGSSWGNETARPYDNLGIQV